MEKHTFLFKKYNKTINRFGFCNIQNNQDLGNGYQPQPSASAENLYLDLDYSVYHKSLSVIVCFICILHDGDYVAALNWGCLSLLTVLDQFRILFHVIDLSFYYYGEYDAPKPHLILQFCRCSRPIERTEQLGRRIKKQQSFFSHYTYQVLNQRHEKINYVHNETQTKAAVFTFVSRRQWNHTSSKSTPQLSHFRRRNNYFGQVSLLSSFNPIWWR